MSDKKNIVNAHNQPNLCPNLFPSLGTNLTKKKPNIIVNPSPHNTNTNTNTKNNLNINSNKHVNKSGSTAQKSHNDDTNKLLSLDDLNKNTLLAEHNKNTLLDKNILPDKSPVKSAKIDSTFKEIEKNNSNDSSELDDDSEDSGSNEHITNVPLITELTLSKKETYHYKIIDKYYKTLNVNDVMTLIEIVEKKSKVSLRLIDWFVTKYSYKHKIRLETNTDPNNIDNGFNVHISYKAQLQSYKKKYFDPFRRRKRLKFKYFFDREKKISLCTTIGQLNFFKWAFTNNIVAYVLNNCDTIAKAMTQSNKLDKSKKQGVSNSDNANSVDVVSNSDNASTNTSTNTNENMKNKKVKENIKGPIKRGKKSGIAKPLPKNPNDTMSLKF